MKYIISALALWGLMGVGAQAQETLKLDFTGRALFDVATYSQNDASKAQDGDLHDGAGVRDIRLGVRATYGQWTLRGEMGYTNNAVSARDVFLQYSFQKENFIRVGYYLVPFGLSSSYSSAKKEYMDEPQANVYEPGRRMGVMHTIYNQAFWAQYGVFADRNAWTQSTDNSGQQGYSASGRFVWRAVRNKDYGVYLGISGMRLKAESTSEGKHPAIAYSKRYLTIVDRTNATAINITDARWENKFTAEFQGIYHNFQLSSQYYWSHIAREGGNSYNTDGFYVCARGILINPANYKYNYGFASVDNPENKNLELALGYGYLNLRDSEAYAKNQAAIAAGYAGIDLSNAGRMSDLTVGLSYFLNKHITFRVNYHYIHVSNFGLASKNVNVLQARAQYLF